MTTAQIAPRNIDGHDAIVGPADVITAALNGAAPITINTSRIAGDVVWLKPITVWGNDGLTVEHTRPFVQHPEFGEILAAYIDTTRLDQAPGLRAIRQARHDQLTAQQRRIDASVPSCDNCGDCARCV